MSIELRGKTLGLRTWQKGDEEALAQLANNRKIWMNLKDSFPHPYARKDAEAWIESVLKHGDAPHHFAIVRGDEVLGCTGFEPYEDVHRLTAGVGYWIGEPYWGGGMATEALGLLTEYVFERFDFERLEAAVYAWNPASRRVLEKAGFACEGKHARSVVKDGQLIDSWIYARLRSDPPARGS